MGVGKKSIVYKNITDLKPYETNPRKNDNAVEGVAASIKEFGFQSPIIIDKDNVVVCGHTRLKAAKKLRLKSVPCIIADDLSEQQIKAFRLADNKVSEKAEWDDELLSFELDGITDFDMDVFGFGDDEDDNGAEWEEGLSVYEGEDDEESLLAPPCQHNVFENQERMQFPITNYFGLYA